jgi:soluble lytic murein transglycosylase-like protein
MKTACFMLILFSSCSGWSHSVQASRQEAEYYVTAYAQHYRVPVDFVRALIAQESGWQPCAISPKGAAGLMQLMPDTSGGTGSERPLRYPAERFRRHPSSGSAHE